MGDCTTSPINRFEALETTNNYTTSGGNKEVCCGQLWKLDCAMRRGVVGGADTPLYYLSRMKCRQCGDSEGDTQHRTFSHFHIVTVMRSAGG